MSSVEDRLRKLEEHPEYPRAMRHVPSQPTTMMLVLGIGFGAAAIVVAVTSSGPLLVPIVLGGFALVLIALAVFFVVTPLERVLAEVASERVRTETRRDDDGARRTRRSHFVVLERLDGIKREYKSSRDLDERIEEGDAGVAYLKAGFLLDFRPLR